MSFFKYIHHSYIRIIEADTAREAYNIGKEQEKLEICFNCTCLGATFWIKDHG